MGWRGPELSGWGVFGTLGGTGGDFGDAGWCGTGVAARDVGWEVRGGAGVGGRGRGEGRTPERLLWPFSWLVGRLRWGSAVFGARVGACRRREGTVALRRVFTTAAGRARELVGVARRRAHHQPLGGPRAPRTALRLWPVAVTRQR